MPPSTVAIAPFNTFAQGPTDHLTHLNGATSVNPTWGSVNDLLASLSTPASTSSTSSHRLNVKTHVFKKEMQEYIPTQLEDRLRIETIIYVELSIVDHAGDLVNSHDYLRLPKDLFYAQPDKIMTADEMATKRILDVSASLQCPSNGWLEEKEACVRCARRMSAKMEETESRIMHMLPELYRTEDGDALISFRSGVANIQFKVNCYCGHKKEKEGFVIRFDSVSDASVASHVTLPLMFYHQNKNRIASRAAKAEAKAKAKAEQQLQQQQASAARNIVKSATSKTKREDRPSSSRMSPLAHSLPSPPRSSLSSPVEYSSSPDMDDFTDPSDHTSSVPSPPLLDPLISLFPDFTQDQATTPQNQRQDFALISHMTPNSGPVRGGTLVTIHGSGFTVGELMYVCFGDNPVPIIPQRDHMLECYTPASTKADTVTVYAMNAIHPSLAPATFTYVDDNEKELIKLALQRMMSISAKMDGPLDSVLNRANEFTLWNDLLEGNLDGSSSSSFVNNQLFSDLEKVVLESFQLVDKPTAKNMEGLSIVNSTGHTMLHLSVSLQYEALARDLLRRGVNTQVQDKNGLTALDLARLLENEGMIRLLSDVSDVKLTKAIAPMEAIPYMTDKFLDQEMHDVVESVVLKDGEGARNIMGLQSSGLGRDHDPAKSKDYTDTLGSLSSLMLPNHGPGKAAMDWSAIPASQSSNEATTPPSTCSSAMGPADLLAPTGHALVAAKGSTADIGPSRIRQDLIPMHLQETSSLCDVMDVAAQSRAVFRIKPDHVAFLRGSDSPVVVAGAEAVAVIGHGVGGSVVADAAEQVAVQSNRDDVESEPLFLGGLPVNQRTRFTTAETVSTLDRRSLCETAPDVERDAEDDNVDAL